MVVVSRTEPSTSVLKFCIINFQSPTSSVGSSANHTTNERPLSPKSICASFPSLELIIILGETNLPDSTAYGGTLSLNLCLLSARMAFKTSGYSVCRKSKIIPSISPSMRYEELPSLTQSSLELAYKIPMSLYPNDVISPNAFERLFPVFDKSFLEKPTPPLLRFPVMYKHFSSTLSRFADFAGMQPISTGCSAFSIFIFTFFIPISRRSIIFTRALSWCDLRK
mmetsp:Transcript_5608/g.8233  ORF Transcript_5608/g.8233 Transcript_5608/m.8233 type:complete len:224 (-) Transcript_5608:223-894(-)